MRNLFFYIGGALLLATGAAVVTLETIASTGDSALDDQRIRGRVIVNAIRVFGPQRLAGSEGRQILRALMSIVNNEWNRKDVVLGDTSAPGGPSVGPMQVYRKTAKELSLWTPPEGASEQEERDAYAALAGDFGYGIFAGVSVFKDKLDNVAHGDIEEAIRKYNGGGLASRSYRDRALAFASDTWGSLDAEPTT